MFKTTTGTFITHIPYRGAAQAVTGLMAGEVDMMFENLPSVLGQIQGGEMVAIAVASDSRAPQLPDVKLLKEQGIVGGEADSWLALFAPAKVPPAVLATLSNAVLDAIRKPALAANAVKQGIAVNVREPSAFQTYLADEMKKWAQVIKQAQVKVD